MSDGAFSDHVAQLRKRWESDPSSRIFLQLAEEYRHQGRVKEALSVLDRGLKEHPGYLSALVAKGRCHLELGEPEPARGVLERVVKQDATQMVANKLLVRAYLDTGEPERARERLDLYSLLNDSDPEIEELSRRLQAMERPPQAAPPMPIPVLTPTSIPASIPASGGDVFDLDPPAPRHAAADVFELDVPAPRAKMAVPQDDDPFADLLAPPPAPVAAPAEAAPQAASEPVMQEEPEPEGALFTGLASRESRQRYLSGLAAEGLFQLDPGVEAPAAVAPPVFEPEPVFDLAPSELSELSEPSEITAPEPVPSFEDQVTEVWRRPAQEEAPPPVFDLEERTPWAAEPEPFVPDFVPEPAPEFVPEPEPEPVYQPVAEPAATVTLGELYLRQGHLAEAGRIFQEVLRHEPDSSAAQEGLERLAAVRAEKRPLVARDLLAGYEPGHEGGEAETRARKAWVLSGYLRRLRGDQHDVS
jgi:tetratricopeptide (TPR) repeat protein